MLFGLITFLTALTISGVAIYYSVAGLVAIFAAAAVPIIIMGTALEIGKLVTAVWLHRYWAKAAWWLRTYLSIAVFVLMLITSMGIFGFLSKAHVDQNLSSDTVTQRIEIIDNKVRAENSYIERQKDVLERLTGQSTGSNDRFNQDIQIEQKKIDDAYRRLEVLDADVKAYTDQGKGLFKGDNIKRGLEVRKSQQAERDRINQQILDAQENINKLRAQINNALDKNDVSVQSTEKNIFDAQGRIELLIIEQEPLKGQLMKLESEVGPIRYIAEFVYGEEADRNLLEEAVRWVIITIIFVFDPLAVLLLIASQYTFRWRYIEKHGELPPAPKTPPAPTTPPAPKKPIAPIIPPAPAGGQSLAKIVEKQKEVQVANPLSKEEKAPTIKLSDIAEKKPVSTMPSAEKLEEFKKREQEEKQKLEEVARKTKEDELAKQVEEIKTTLENIEPGKVVRPGLTGAGLTLGGRKPEPVEPPMPLEQWNQMIEEAEKEVSKEVKQPQPDGFDEDEVKYDIESSKATESEKLQQELEPIDENNDGIDDNTGQPITGIVPTKGTFVEAEALQKKKSLSYIMRERNQQVKKEHQEE